jgi:tetratricopeptide (TPR) repeat protein
MANFTTDAWFQAARERFGRVGEYPLIDDAEIIENSVLHDFWPWVYHFGRHSAEELFEQALTSDHWDLPVRFVYLNLFFRLAHYPVEKFADVVEDQDGAAGHRAQFLGYLETLVRLAESNKCEDPRNVRWEIVNACCIRDWARVRQLYDRLEALVEEHEVAQVLAQRGQQEFLSVFADSWELNDPYCWAPLPDKQTSFWLRSNLCLRCAADRSVPAFSGDELERLGDAAYHLEKANRAKPDLSPVFRFLLLRCNMVLGKFQESARVCEELLATHKTFARFEPDPDESVLVSYLYARLVEAARSADDIERAISANRRWIEVFPNEPGTLKQLSDLFWLQGDVTNEYDYLRKEVERNPARGDDPAISMALAFGGVYRGADALLADFKKQVDQEKLKQMGTVVRVHWPQVDELDADSVEDWVTACYCLSCHELDCPRVPIFLLGGLLESELRVRIFDRFRGSLSQSEIQSIRKSKEMDALTRYLENYPLALGHMLNEFLHWDQPRSGASRQFRGWLDRESSGLVPSLQKNDLRRPAALHNAAKHPSGPPLSWDDAADMARLSRRLLSAVIEHESCGAVKK